MYNLNNLSLVESVNRILVKVQDDKVDLVRRKVKLTGLMGSSTASANVHQEEVNEVAAEVADLITKIAQAMGEEKSRLEAKLLRVQSRQMLLALDKGGVETDVERQHEMVTIDRDIAEKDVFIAALQERLNTLQAG